MNPSTSSPGLTVATRTAAAAATGPQRPMVDTLGLRAARLLQRLARLDQVHIIGCSRSGTTAVQFAMIAFQGVIIANGETSANYPYLRPLLGHLGERENWRRSAMLLTKRNPGWYRPADLAALVRRVQRDSVGIIHLVRDPRDVMSSVHVKAADTPYVTPGLWLQSIQAAETIRASMPAGGRYLTLRYEDFVLDPRRVESELHARLGLQLRAGVRSVAEVKTNIEQSGYRISAGMLANMHRLRNMDTGSLYRWRREGFDLDRRVTDPDIRGRVTAFITEFSYPD